MSKNFWRNQRRKRKPVSPTLFIVGGLILVAIAILLLKPRADSPIADALPEEKRANALAAGHPAFVFLHSLDCTPCKEMMGIVDEVHPEFEGKVVLVDVDVYDQRNANILRLEGLQAIPTLIFYDRQGGRQMHVGVLPLEQLRFVFQTLAGGN